MPIVRTNPLPLGIFWLDVFSPPMGKTTPNNWPVWTAWLYANADRVKVLKHQGHHAPLSGLNDPAFDTPAHMPRRDFVVFQTTDADTTRFPMVELGFPTIVELGAPEVVNETKAAGMTSDDTVSKLPPETMLGTLEGALESFGTLGKLALGLGVLYLGVRVLEATQRR